MLQVPWLLEVKQYVESVCLLAVKQCYCIRQALVLARAAHERWLAPQQSVTRCSKPASGSLHCRLCVFQQLLLRLHNHGAHQR